MFLARHTSLLRNADSPVSAFAKQRIASRREQLSSLKHSADPAAAVEGGQAQSQGSGQHGVDFLTRFTIAQTEHPEFMTDARVLTACTSLINAGSDTTAATLSAVFYYLLKHRRAYDTLMQELDGASAAGTVAFSEAGTIAWADARKLPYLDAVINETFRLFPAVGLLLERHVPPQGASICGEWIPGGAIVGCNAWVLHRRPEIFGEDVEAFRPERWLEVDEEKRRAMEAGLFQFGAGTRTCIGRNISVMEVYKLVPAFVRRFEVGAIEIRSARDFQARLQMLTRLIHSRRLTSQTRTRIGGPWTAGSCGSLTSTCASDLGRGEDVVLAVMRRNESTK